MGVVMERTVKLGEEGFILVFTLLLLVVVTLLGVSSIDTSVFESAMSANDALYKRAFYQADGGANVAAVVIEENVSCPTGFSAMSGYSGGALLADNVLVEASSLKLWDITPTAADPSDTNRNAYFFYDASDPAGTNLAHTNITVGGVTTIATGAGLQMAAGYEGRGKGMAGGGGLIEYDVFSQHIGDRQSESIVEIEWRHVIGFEGNCKY
jgi:hypothetical protein